MKKKTIRLALLLLTAVIVSLAMVACGGGKESGGAYKVDDVRTKLAAALNIDESAIKETERDGTTILSYGLDGISVDAYIMKNAKAAQDYFSIPAMAGSFSDKRVDKDNHKIWVSEVENWATGETIYNTLAMKDNFIILNIGTDLAPEDVIATFDME